jgi:signal transduction histidine kinase
MERRNQLLTSFANTVSHDLRNPLSVAQGQLELAQETGDFEHLDAVARAHNRMRDLIDELLRLARGEEVTFTTVSLRERAEAAWSTISSDDLTLVIDEDAQIEANESQLRQLFENLFWNTIEHAKADRIAVGITADCLYVADDGNGIPAAERESVFEAGKTTTQDGPGYGLHIVARIAEMHGWEITVTDGPSGGARFEIRGIQFADE